jgi:hypothetical protein
MQDDLVRTVTYDGDIVRIDGKPLRMEFMVRDAFWAGDRAVVLLDPKAFLDDPVWGGARKKARGPVRNLRAYAPSGELLWEAEQPETEDHYYLIENRAPLVALSFSAYRCDLDLASGRILARTKLK